MGVGSGWGPPGWRSAQVGSAQVGSPPTAERSPSGKGFGAQRQGQAGRRPQLCPPCPLGEETVPGSGVQLARAARESSRQGDECPKRAVPACAVDRAGAACSQLRMRTFWKITEFHKCEERVKTLFKHAFTKYFF